MPHRPDWFVKITERDKQDHEMPRSLLDIALDVHMATTGGAEASPQDQKDDVEVLSYALRSWEPSRIYSFSHFDRAVKMLIEVTLDEYQQHGKWFTDSVKSEEEKKV